MSCAQANETEEVSRVRGMQMSLALSYAPSCHLWLTSSAERKLLLACDDSLPWAFSLQFFLSPALSAAVTNLAGGNMNEEFIHGMLIQLVFENTGSMSKNVQYGGCQGFWCVSKRETTV